MDAAADRAHALDVLGDRCHRQSGAVLRGLLDRFRARPHDVARALRGRPMYGRVALDDPRTEAWVVFTGDGHVAVLGDEAMHPERELPDLRVQGSGSSVLAALLGVTEARAALDTGVLIPMVPTDRIEPLLSLVGRELVAVAAGY